MSTFDVNNPYFRTKVLTASREELRMLLLEGALRFMRQGRDALVAKDWEGVYDGFTQAKAIVLELTNSMRPEVAPDLVPRMQSLYVFIYRLLVEASFEKDVAKADEAIRLMEYERETWGLLMERVAAGRAGGAGGAGGAEASDGAPETAGQIPAPGETAPAAYKPLSVSG